MVYVRKRQQCMRQPLAATMTCSTHTLLIKYLYLSLCTDSKPSQQDIISALTSFPIMSSIRQKKECVTHSIPRILRPTSTFPSIDNTHYLLSYIHAYFSSHNITIPAHLLYHWCHFQSASNIFLYF